MDQSNNSAPQIEKLLAESSTRYEGGDIQSAVNYAQQALAEAIQSNAFDLIPAAQAYLARGLSYLGRAAEARQCAEKVLENQKETIFAAHALTTLGLCASKMEEPCSGEPYFHQAATLCRKIGYIEGLAHALYNLARWTFMPTGRFDMALNYATETQQLLVEKTGHAHWGPPFLKAFIYETLGDRKRTRQALDELVPFVEPATLVAGAYFFQWVRLALDEGDLDKAEEYLHLLVRIANTSGAPELNVWARLEYGRMHRLKGNPATARTWAEDGLGFARQSGYPFLVGQALIECAQTAWESGDPTSASCFLDEASTVLETLGAQFELARADYMRAVWDHKQQHPNAEQSWLKAAQGLITGGYTFFLERERDDAFPLLVAYSRSQNPAARKAAETLLQGLAEVSPPPLKINGLGEFNVWQGRHTLTNQNWQRRKAGELFRYLLLQPNRAAGRDILLEALWPEHDPQTALALLHQATSTLRHILEPDLPDKFPSRYLSVEGERVSLRLPEGSVVDFDDFERKLPVAIQSRRVDRLQPVLALYQNDLFPTDQYNDWSVGRRERLSEMYQQGLLALGQAYLAGEQYFRAVDCVRMILQRDPWSEDAVLLGMKAYLGMRNAPHAIQLYQKLEAVLKEELNLVPRTDLRTLVKEIRSGGKEV